MEIWGWLILLLLCSITLIASCTNTPLPSTSPTQSPAVTILSQSPEPEETSAPSFLPTITTQSVPTTETSASLLAPSPTCYETVAGGILCMGYVENESQAALYNIVLDVGIYDMTGALITSDETALHQDYIPPGGRAPYHVVFAAQEGRLYPADVFGNVQVLRAAADVLRDYAAPFAVQDQEGIAINGRYRVIARLPKDAIDTMIQAVVILYDDAERVVGYRIVEDIAPEMLQIEIIPEATLHHFTINIFPATLHTD